MSIVVDQSAWWNQLLTSATFTWLGGTATYKFALGVMHIDFSKFSVKMTLNP